MVKRVELLSPAGNMEMLKFAIFYGADAVYLAGNKFGARKFADNFDREALIEAVKFAHLYGVRVYITINTLIKEKEIDEFIEYVKFIDSIGVDAVLVQDLGMLSLIGKVAPELELHASTQMHNNGSNIIDVLKKYNVKRVVLDREMSLDEISSLPDTIEKEVFCHGALCVAYSGQCLFSSLVLNRSGNRGECAGMCRLPFRAGGENKKQYYLSLKDLCTINSIDRLLDIGVDSLKIEGRMKSPEYVGYITHVYREAIDSYYEGNFKSITPEKLENMKLLFYRGFTEGFMFGASSHDIVSRDSNNHIGIHLGEYSIYKDKVKLTLDANLSQGDVIRFTSEDKGMTVNFLYNKREELINSATKGETVFVDNFLGLEESGEIRKVESASLMQEIRNLPSRRVSITGKIVIRKNKPIELTLDDGINTISVSGTTAEEAKSAPIRVEDVKKQIGKMGNTVYELTDLDVDIESNLFVNIKALNEIRRDATKRLDDARMSIPNSKKHMDYLPATPINSEGEILLDVVVSTDTQYEAARTYASRIFSSNEDIISKYPDVKTKYEERATKLEGETCIIGDLGSIVHKGPNQSIITDYMLNVLNSYTAKELKELGAETVCLSIESTLENTRDLINNVDSSLLEVFLYGKLELMKMKFDPLYDKDNKTLIDRNNEEYTIRYGKKVNYLIGNFNIDKRKEIEDYLSLGIKKFRIDFYAEERDEVIRILEDVHKKLF